MTQEDKQLLLKDIGNVTASDRKQLHDLLDQMLYKGEGIGTLSVAYNNLEDFTIREYRLRLSKTERKIPELNINRTQQDREFLELCAHVDELPKDVKPNGEPFVK